MVVSLSLALALIAAWLWLGGAGQPVSHGEIGARDREALRELLQDESGR